MNEHENTRALVRWTNGKQHIYTLHVHALVITSMLERISYCAVVWRVNTIRRLENFISICSNELNKRNAKIDRNIHRRNIETSKDHNHHHAIARKPIPTQSFPLTMQAMFWFNRWLVACSLLMLDDRISLTLESVSTWDWKRKVKRIAQSFWFIF